MTLTKAAAAAEVMIHLCKHSAHGYSQPARKGDGSTETVVLSDGSKVYINGGDKDCSEAVRMCWAAVGVLPKDSYMWTGNERELLLKHGFKELPFAGTKLQTGDVLWKEGHTELVVSEGMQGGFNGDENGGIGFGAKVGDQTGYESYIKPVRSYWQKVYRYEQKPAGWVKGYKGRWWWRDEDGGYPANEWRRINRKWYHFDSKGYMQTGWIKEGEDWYYLQSNGAMLAKTCAQINGAWYVFERNGRMSKNVHLAKNGSIIFD